MENIFEKACQYALIKHKNQYRKDGSIYILHPFEVATIAGTMTNDLDVLSAAVLHDVLEDSDASLIEIKELFNDRVCKLISLETEEKYPNLSKKDSWKLRKIEAIKRLEETDDIGFKIIYLADKLSNIRSLLRDINNNGIQAFNKLDIDKEKKNIKITFEDNGIPFNPLEKDDPNIDLSINKRKEGGLGIFIVKKMMDNVSYEYKNNKNIFVIEKKY